MKKKSLQKYQYNYLKKLVLKEILFFFYNYFLFTNKLLFLVETLNFIINLRMLIIYSDFKIKLLSDSLYLLFMN